MRTLGCIGVRVGAGLRASGFGVDAGADKNMQNGYGNTALMLTSSDGPIVINGV